MCSPVMVLLCTVPSRNVMVKSCIVLYSEVRLSSMEKKMLRINHGRHISILHTVYPRQIIQFCDKNEMRFCSGVWLAPEKFIQCVFCLN